MKKLLAVCLVIGMLLSLCACSSAKAKTPEEVLSEAFKNLKNVNSCAFCMTEEIGVQGDGMEMGIKVKLEGEGIQDPLAMHVKMDMTYAVLTLKMEMYIQENGEDLDVYVGMDMGSGMQWSKETWPAFSEADVFEIYDGVEELSYWDDLKEVGKEKLDGIHTTCYEARFTGRNLKNLIAELLGIVEPMAEEDEDISEVLDVFAEVFDKLSDDVAARLTFHVDTKHMVLVQASLDMRDLMNELLGILDPSLGETFTKMRFSPGYRGFNEIDRIQIPEEVLRAPML